MATPPDFTSGQVLTAAHMNGVGLWKLVPTTVTNGTFNAVGDITVGSGVSSVAVNGVFNSNYDNYRISINNIVASTGGDLRFQLGTTATGYYGVYNYQVYTGTSSVFYQNNTANSYIGGLGTIAGEQSIIFDIFNPNKATRSVWHGQAYGNGYYFNWGYQIADTTQYTSFTISPGTGTLTGGSISVYGYN
jgi:hypothetical protein